MTTDTMRAAVGARCDALMKLADEAIHAYGAWLAEFIAGELPSHHAERLNAEKDAAREKLRLALAALEEGGEPHGWKLVPMEPTAAMLDAVAPDNLTRPRHEERDRVAAIYRAMLAASPTAAPKEEGEPVAQVVDVYPPGKQRYEVEFLTGYKPKAGQLLYTRPIAADTQGDAKDAAQREEFINKAMDEACDYLGVDKKTRDEGLLYYFAELLLNRRATLSPSLNEGKAK